MNEPSTIWINGERQSSSDCPHVSARDRGLTLADGLFETMYVRNGRVLRLDEHLARLEHGLGALRMPRVAEARAWVIAALDESAAGEASLRLTVTRGQSHGGLAPSCDTRPLAIVTMSPMPSFASSIYDRGLTAHVASGRLNERSMTAGLKTLSYTDNVAAFLEAQAAGADDALFLDTESHCSEAAASNLFMWSGDALVTPPRSCGVLPGVTRAAVLELAHAAGVSAIERAFDLDELLSADEAFLTSSLRGVAPLVRIGDRTIGSGSPGERTRGIIREYSALVARETA